MARIDRKASAKTVVISTQGLLDVGILLDFAQACEEAKLPNSTKIVHTTENGKIVQLSAFYEWPLPHPDEATSTQ